MLRQQQPTEKKTRQRQQSNSIKDDYSITEEEDDEEEEEEEIIRYKPTQKKYKSNQYSNSPEPIIKKQRDPNRKDKIGRTKIFQATTAGHLDKVIELIEQGANVNFKDNANWTPLHEAANNGRFEIAKYLIKCGAEINVRGYGLDTPLHDACQSNSAPCVKLLVDAGADVFALNEKNQRPIDLCNSEACQSILTTKMKELDNVIKRDKTGKSLLHHACLKDQCEKARDLIRLGADVNAKDNQEATPLHFACSKGYMNVVKLLFEQGALVNILGTELGDTPLHQASRYGHEHVVRYLINVAHADVNMENKSRKNAYQVAAAFPPIIRQMLTARMDELKLEKESCHALDETARKMALQNEPERQLTREERKIQSYMRVFAKLEGNQGGGDSSSSSAFDDLFPLPSPSTSTRRKRKSTISRKSASVERDLSLPSSPTSLKRQKLDPFKKDTCGGTQLHKYANRGDCDAVQQLLESGAKPDETDNAGWTALHEAALKGHIDVVKLLLKYGADTNVKGGDLDTPLHDATENNHCDIVELLLEHGADPFARNINNAEPIDIATHHEFQDIVLVLQNANPVKKKKRTRVKKEMMTDEVTIPNSESQPSPIATKKRRLIRAVDLESNHSSNNEEDEEEEEVIVKRPSRLKKLRQRSSSPELVTVKLEEEGDTKENIQKVPSKKNYPNVPRVITAPKSIDTAPKVIDHNQIYLHHRHSPIHTPPPELWTKQKQNAKIYSPMYTIQPKESTKNYVVDLQVSLFLGFHNLDDFWKLYSTHTTLFSSKKFIHANIKLKLWPTFKTMLSEEKSTFLSRHLQFIDLADVVQLMKQDYHHLLDNFITINLDVDYEDIIALKKQCSLPPKIAMKMKKCGYKFQQYS